MVLISRRYPCRDGHSCQVQGPWSLILDPWSLILDPWYLILDTWYLILDVRSLILDHCSLIIDLWSLIFDQWSMIHDPWSMMRSLCSAYVTPVRVRSGSGPVPVGPVPVGPEKSKYFFLVRWPQPSLVPKPLDKESLPNLFFSFDKSIQGFFHRFCGNKRNRFSETLSLENFLGLEFEWNSVKKRVNYPHGILNFVLHNCNSLSTTSS